VFYRAPRCIAVSFPFHITMVDDGTQQHHTLSCVAIQAILSYYIQRSKRDAESNNYITIIPWNLAVKKCAFKLGFNRMLVKPSDDYLDDDGPVETMLQ
jgi:hypothetical protein